MLRHTLCIKEGERNMQHANYVCVSVTKQKRNLCWQIYEILNKKLTFLNQHALSKFLSRTGRCFTLFLSRVFKTKLSLCLGICSSKRKGNCSDFTGCLLTSVFNLLQDDFQICAVDKVIDLAHFFFFCIATVLQWQPTCTFLQCW